MQVNYFSSAKSLSVFTCFCGQIHKNIIYNAIVRSTMKLHSFKLASLIGQKPTKIKDLGTVNFWFISFILSSHFSYKEFCI